jgi:hypothetical protein
MGVEPSSKIDTADDACKKVLNTLEKEYKLVSEHMIEKKQTLKKAIKELNGSGELQTLKDEMDYKLVQQYMSLKHNEEETVKVLAKKVHEHPMWNRFFKDVKGCGELMAANCIAYLDIDKARHASSFWKYCGLDVVTVIQDDGTEETHGRRKGDTAEYDYVAKDGTTKKKKGLTYNPELKCKLVGVLSGCMIKAAGKNPTGHKYVEAYRDYKNRLENSEVHKDKTAGHKNAMAIRYMIKQFLRDLWVVWREYEGYELSEPYSVAYLKRNPHKYNQAHYDAAQRTKGHTPERDAREATA